MARWAVAVVCAALFLLVCIPGCSNDKELGTCLKGLSTWCSVNAPRYQCSGPGDQFFVGENAGAGVLHCSAARFTKANNMAQPLNGTSYRIDAPGHEREELQRALDKGDMVSYFREHGR
jgi:hypothetical protein